MAATEIRVIQTKSFAKLIKKFSSSDRHDLENAICKIIDDPTIGKLKIGDLSDVRVLKFSMHKQQWLLAYMFEKSINTIILLAVGPHENFYKKLKEK